MDEQVRGGTKVKTGHVGGTRRRARGKPSRSGRDWKGHRARRRDEGRGKRRGKGQGTRDKMWQPPQMKRRYTGGASRRTREEPSRGGRK